MTDLRHWGQTVFCRDVDATARIYGQPLGTHPGSASDGDTSTRADVEGAEV